MNFVEDERGWLKEDDADRNSNGRDLSVMKREV